MSVKRGRTILSLLTLGLGTTVLPTAAVAADQPDPAVRVHTTIEVVAEGLDTPRGLTYDARNHRVLVAEAGEGGPSQPGGGTCGSSEGGALWCYGPTGAVFQYSERRRTAHRVIEGLPSIAVYDDTGTERWSVSGLHDLSVDRRGHLRAVFGLVGDPAFRSALGSGATALGQLGRLHGHSDRITLEADLARYEQQHDPDSLGADANPYGVSSGPYGTGVVDASGNDLLLVRRDGTIELLAVLPTRVPAANPEATVESVPTTVEVGPDGAFYVGELTGFPYYKGEAKVWRVVPGRAPAVYADGFTTIADITFDERGRLIVLEMAKEGMFPDNPGHNGDTVTGRLVRLNADGSRTDLATTGLENPGGVAYARHGVFYVTNRTTGVGDTGQLLRIEVRDR